MLASPASGSPWQTVAVEGERNSDGHPYGALILASEIADDGSVAFIDTSPNLLTTPQNYSLWRWSGASGAGRLATIELSPGTTAWRHAGLLSNGAGDLAWRDGEGITVVSCGGEDSAEQTREFLYVLPRNGTVSIVAETGTAAPGGAGWTLARLLAPIFRFPWVPVPSTRSVLSRDFLVGFDAVPLFRAELADDPCFSDGPEADFVGALFAPDGAGAPTLIAREGDPLPGASEGEVLATLEGTTFTEDGRGTVFASVEFAATASPVSQQALLRWRPPALGPETVARSDRPTAFLGGARLASFRPLQANPGGVLALLGVHHESAPAPIGGRGGIWVGDADGLEEVISLLGSVPGGPPGAEFTVAAFAHASSLVVNDSGEIAFTALFSTTPGSASKIGLFAPGSDGLPTLRMATGDPAPGAAGLLIVSVEPKHLASDGALLAIATLSKSLFWSGSEQHAGAWYWVPRTGAPQLLLRSDVPIEIAPGDFRMLRGAVAYDTQLAWIAAEFGASLLYSARAEAIAVRAVPEPGAALAGITAVTCLAGFGAGRRRQREGRR